MFVSCQRQLKIRVGIQSSLTRRKLFIAVDRALKDTAKFISRYATIFIMIRVKILSMQDSLLQRITINPAICHGKPTIRNKRYSVENMLELMASRMTNEEILADYEDLEIEDLRACLLFAARLASVGSITELIAA